MKTKFWIAVIAAVLAVCAGLSAFFFLGGEEASSARVLSGGELVCVLDLDDDTSFLVEHDGGTNEITVRDGKVAVTAADCPDHYCMDMGWRSGGAPIVCLPNALVIEFTEDTGVDGAVG